DDLGTASDMDVATDLRTLEIAGAQTDGHPRKDHGTRLDRDDSVDDDLTVRDVDARLHDDGIADADLGGGHRQPVCEARQDRDSARLHPGLGPVAPLREERVADPHQPERLARGVDPCSELVRLGAETAGHLRIFQHRPEERWVLRSDLRPEVLRLRIGTATARHTQSLRVVAGWTRWP